MASEVNHHVGYSRENECWFVRFYPYQTEQQANEAAAAFTRPAPAATDTGLVTKGFLFQTLTERNGWALTYSTSDPAQGGLPYRAIEPVCLRSQAEELLAAEQARADANFDKVIEQAKRAELAELKERWLKEMVTTIISNPIGSVQHYRAVEDARLALGNPEAALSENEKLIQRAEKAEADNAAKDARVKELEEEVEWAQNAVLARQRHAEARCEALEAKLAAAEEVAQLVIQAEEDKSGDPNFYILMMQTAYDKARAVLGGKTS